jgi:hypothetical protein
VREVAEGRAQFGTGGAELVVRAAQGLPLLLLAPIFQQSGAGVFYREDGDFASPGALSKARVGRLPASHILDIELATALRAEGVDTEQMKPVPLQAGQTVAALAERSVDAAPGSAWEVPWLAHERGFALKSFNPADYRVEFYGDTLFTMQRIEKAEPAAVRAFRAASLRGWEYALKNPDEVAARLVSEIPRPGRLADLGGFTRYQAELAALLARHPAVTLGHSNPERWRRIQTSMLGAGALLRTADPESFVYDPDAEQRSRTDLRAFAIIGATLAAGVVAIMLLWWVRRRRPAAPAGAAEPRAETAAVAVAATPAPDPATASAPAPASASAPAPTPATATASAPTPTPAMAETPSPSATPPVAPAPTLNEPAPVDLNPVLRQLERALRRRLTRRVSFRQSLLPDLWPCRADPETVRRLVLDLTDAAASDLKGGGELVVGTRNFGFDAATAAATPGAEPGEFARITVRDSGPGLSDEALDRVLDSAASARPSAAAAAQAVRAFGGFVRVESAEGVGTAVHVYFPRAAAPAQSEKAAAQAAE